MANSAAIRFRAPHPRFDNSRIAVTISPSTTGASELDPIPWTSSDRGRVPTHGRGV